MPRLLQFIAVLLCLLASQPLRAFSLLGPLPTNPGGGGEAWQTLGLGYNALGNDIGAPKNLGEEYRWNVPVLTYAFDSSFINYFGNEGIAAVDAAFAIMNSLPDLSTLSTNFSEFPLVDPTTGSSTTFRDARRINLRAEADNLLDLKSMMLGVIVEELGLASPERWTWALRARNPSANNTITNYLNIQRNFDPVTLKPSKYVNGTRYTFQDLVFPVLNYEDAVESTVTDPEQIVSSFSSVANILGGDRFSLFPGIFYTYLTRDDIGGLRYLYNANNLNWEPFPAGTLQFTVDHSNGFTSITNQDLTLLSLRSLTSSTNLLLSFYPGLIIGQATPNGTTIQSNVPVVVTQFVNLLFITNFDNPTIVSNIDLATFSSVTLTSAPANLVVNLQAAFPGVPNLDQLVVLSTNFSATTVVQVASIVLTNLPKQPWDDPFTTNFVFRTNFVTVPEILYHYNFRNVLTNYSSPFTTIFQVISGIDKEPWSDALNPVFKTTSTSFQITQPSGAVTIIPTNLVGYVFTGPNTTNVVALTNFFFSTNVVDLTSGLTRTVSKSDVTLFTNVLYFAYTIDLLPTPFVTNILVTNAFVTTNVATFNYSFTNVITNYFGPNTPATRTRVQIVTDPNNPALTRTNLVLNESTALPVPSGGFIIDTNQTGFEFGGTTGVSIIPVTNIVFDITDQNGLRTVEQVVYNFTNTIYQVFPIILTNAPATALRPGVSKLQFKRIGGTIFTGTNYFYTNRYTASFYDTNLFFTNAVFVEPQTLPNFLIRASDLGLTANGFTPVFVSRTPNFVNNAGLNSTVSTAGGPGTISGTVFVDFTQIGPTLIGQLPGFTTEASAISSGLDLLFWGSFDGSTNAPIVYPSDITLENIEPLKTGGAVP